MGVRQRAVRSGRDDRRERGLTEAYAIERGLNRRRDLALGASGGDESGQLASDVREFLRRDSKRRIDAKFNAHQYGNACGEHTRCAIDAPEPWGRSLVNH